MGAYLLRRLGINVLVFLLITIAVFWLVYQTPGDPIASQISPAERNSGSQELIDQRREELGLNDPVYAQYLAWFGRAVQGDLGYSLINGRPVLELLAERIGPTVELMLVGLLLSILIAFPLGMFAALRRNTAVDYLATTVSLGAVSFPPFYLGLIAIYVFSLQWQLLPSSGISDPANLSLLNLLSHLVLPALVLGFGNSGPLMRYVRSSMISELNADYVRTAEAKGASRTRVVVRHTLRNSLIPVLTVIAANLGQLLAGAVVIEQVFAWPGMGQLAISSVGSNDYPVIIGFALIVAILVLLSNLLADVLYTVVDPRVRLT